MARKYGLDGSTVAARFPDQFAPFGAFVGGGAGAGGHWARATPVRRPCPQEATPYNVAGKTAAHSVRLARRCQICTNTGTH